MTVFSPFEATEPAYMTTEAVNANQTKVNWGFSVILLIQQTYCFYLSTLRP
jgi:hypothetical protein